MSELLRHEAQRRARCPLCREGLEEAPGPAELETFDCPTCGTPYHGACYRELGGCAVLGCDGKNPLRPPRTAELRLDHGDVRRSVREGRPIPGTHRDCVGCGAEYVVRERSPYNPRCGSCHTRYRATMGTVAVLVLIGYYLILYLPGLIFG